MIAKTIPEAFLESAEKFGRKTALLYKRDGVYFPITYSQMAEKVKTLAVGLSKFGVQKGDKVAILSENRPEWAIADLATMLLGGIVIPLHITFSPQAISKIIEHSQAKIVIVANNNLLNKILLSQNSLPYLEKIVLLERVAVEAGAWQDRIFYWEWLLTHNDSNLCSKTLLRPDDVCSIVYTSGTTGEPKGVMLTHNNFLSNSVAVTEVVAVKPSDIFLSFLPLSHVLERLAGYYAPLLSGATIAYAENIKQLSANLKEIKPTFLISVPRIFEKMYETIWEKAKTSELKKKIFLWALKQGKKGIRHYLADQLVFKKIRKQLGGRLRLTVSGGAALNEKIARFFLKMGLTVLEGYGLTETSPVVAVNHEKDFKIGAVGKIVPQVEVKISSTKEILVKGPNVFKGYYKNQEETQLAFDENGWFKTGDLGFLDKDGFLTIIGRRKEMLVTSGGKNVWPEAVESELSKDRFIASSIVLGNNHKFIGALITPDWQKVEQFFKENNLPLQPPEQLVNSKVLIDLFQQRLDEKVNPNLSEYEKIRAFKLLPRDFSQEQGELTPTLKLRRHVIEQHYHIEIADLFGE
ncbi:MAG: long-chain fatty acid--CoA ligase [Candidatus Gribaldobacteria bacterium]|nr:long-chain fatty acid--CoA ligase [Candidatus Gribaldobacteria bacterium]